MKITMNIDDSLLERVMAQTGARTKTQAVDLALREMDRRAKLNSFLEKGLADLSPEELRNAVDPGYDILALRAAETPAKYGKRRPAR